MSSRVSISSLLVLGNESTTPQGSSFPNRRELANSNVGQWLTKRERSSFERKEVFANNHGERAEKKEADERTTEIVL